MTADISYIIYNLEVVIVKFSAILAQIWFVLKKLTVGTYSLRWAYIYYKTPLGSEREKLAFEEVINLLDRTIIDKTNTDLLKIYPNYCPPNILRKVAFGNLYAYNHNLLAAAGRYQLRLATDNADKFYSWLDFIYSMPDSETEDKALSRLMELGEVFPSMIVRGYTVTIE